LFRNFYKLSVPPINTIVANISEKGDFEVWISLNKPGPVGGSVEILKPAR